MADGSVFVAGLALGILMTMFFTFFLSFVDHDIKLDKCEKQNNVYKCEEVIQYLPVKTK